MTDQTTPQEPRPPGEYPAGLLRALALVADRTGDWRERALCAETDPDAFFPEKGGSTRPAKKVCAACQVRAECLQDALDRGERFGIWGGLSERERRRLHRPATPAPAAKPCRQHGLPLAGGPVVFDCPAGHALYAPELPGEPAAA